MIQTNMTLFLTVSIATMARLWRLLDFVCHTAWNNKYSGHTAWLFKHLTREKRTVQLYAEGGEEKMIYRRPQYLFKHRTYGAARSWEVWEALIKSGHHWKFQVERAWLPEWFTTSLEFDEENDRKTDNWGNSTEWCGASAPSTKLISFSAEIPKLNMQVERAYGITEHENIA